MNAKKPYEIEQISECTKFLRNEFVPITQDEADRLAGATELECRKFLLDKAAGPETPISDRIKILEAEIDRLRSESRSDAEK